MIESVIALKIDGVEQDVTIRGEFDPGEPPGWDHPGLDACFEAHQLFMNGVDVTNALPQAIINEMEELMFLRLTEDPRP